MEKTIYSKEEIFQDVIKIMKHDYAGYIDKKTINKQKKYKVSNDMNDHDFEKVVQDYLLDFNDGHLWFSQKKKNIINRGFSVRRYRDNLYVTDIGQENRLRLGDKIIKINKNTIPFVAQQNKKQLSDNVFERQLWNGILRMYNNIHFERDGQVYQLTLKNYASESYKPTYKFKTIDDETALIQITDFALEQPIIDLIQSNQSKLSHVKNLIIDVRENNGGNDSFYFPLLNYVFDEKIAFSELFLEDEVMYTNYTKNNCDLWIKELEDYLTQDLDDESKQSIEAEIKLTKNHYKEGLVEVNDETDYIINGQDSPKNVYVLSDFYCGSSGDTFVSNLKKSSKVTVVGRPTMGIMDYFNVVTIDYGSFNFNYSISKMNSKYFFNGKGVEPNVYIPWSPEHIYKDVDLKYVLDLIKQDKS